MPYVRISLYQLVTGNYPELADRAMSELVEEHLRPEPGFLSYSSGRDQDGNVVIINHWDTGEQAQAALAKASAWVQENFTGVLSPIRSHVVEITHSTAAQG